MKFIKLQIVVQIPNENGQKWRRLWGKMQEIGPLAGGSIQVAAAVLS
jgi:hypothetical protein